MKTEEDKSKNPAEAPQENSGLKKKNDRKHPFAAGCLSVIVFITLFFTVYWFTDVPPTYYRWTSVCLVYLRDLIMVVLIAAIIYRIIKSSRLIGWTLLLIGLVLWANWFLSHGHQPNKISNTFGCDAKMRNLYQVIQAYCDGNDGWYPPSLERLVELKQLTAEDVHCPACQWHNPGDIDYWYYGAGVRRSQQDDNDVLLRDKEKNHMKFTSDCLTFEGLRVRSVTIPPEEWGSVFIRTEDKRYFQDGKIVKTW